LRTVVRRPDGDATSIRLTRPPAERSTATRRELELAVRESSAGVLRVAGETIIQAEPQTTDLYSAAVELAAVHRVDLWSVYDELRRLYADEAEVPDADLSHLSAQIARQTGDYEVREESVEEALALVKIADGGFAREIENGAEIYTVQRTQNVGRTAIFTTAYSIT